MNDKIVQIGCFVLIILSAILNIGLPKTSAHSKGPPFVKLNNTSLITNPIVNAIGEDAESIQSITVGADSTSSAFLINEPLTLEIDEQYFPNPYQTISVFDQPKDQVPITVIYQWNFADGSEPVEGQTVTHSYKNPGTYVIDLKVKYTEKSREFSSANSMQIDIVPSIEYQRPLAKINVNNTIIANSTNNTVAIKPAVPISFDASFSTGNIVKYKWDFGDSKISDKKITSHRYSRDSYFPVSVLRVTDENGLVSDAYVTIDLPFGRVNTIQKIWFAIYDFVTGIFYRE